MSLFAIAMVENFVLGLLLRRYRKLPKSGDGTYTIMHIGMLLMIRRVGFCGPETDSTV